MAILAEHVDAVVGVDTHRDTHEAEIADATGAADRHACRSATTAPASPACWPGSSTTPPARGSRSLWRAPAATASALPARWPQRACRCSSAEQPDRRQRRGRGKSDPIDAHLAVLTALRLDTERLPAPRADGDREALRILLGARQDITAASTAQTNRLRALLLARRRRRPALARGALTDDHAAGTDPPPPAARRQP